MTKQVYLDFAAGTPLLPEAFLAMKPYFGVHYANPSALYPEAVSVREAIEASRKIIANEIGAQPDTIIFTSGGTESCATAILGVARKAKKDGIQHPHIITTSIEHHAVLSSVALAEQEGARVTLLPVRKDGHITLSDIQKALRPETVLVSVMYVNNEIGTIAHLPDVGRLVLKYRKKNKTTYPYFHSDACQASTTQPLHVEQLHVDLLSLNASKVYGPKGIGMLYVRRGVYLQPLIPGGGQEFSVRGGTEHVAGIVGFATAFSYARKQREKEAKRLRLLKEYFIKGLTTVYPAVLYNGPHDGTSDSPHHLSVTFPGIDAESLILYLGEKKIAIASGAACASGSEEGSHVLKACGKSEEEIKNTVRFSLGYSTTKKDMRYVLRVLKETIPLLSTMASVS